MHTSSCANRSATGTYAYILGQEGGLFTVEARKSHLIAEYGSKISLECLFKLDLETDFENLRVLWKHMTRDRKDSIEVAKFANGKDIEIFQFKNYSAHMKLLSSELHKGCAILHISNVKMTDAGQYSCIISYIGSDYKEITLDVQAPYKIITTHVREVVNSSGETVREVSCQSFGYPEAEVTWMVDKENHTVVHNTSYTLTTDMLFNVTSVVRIPDKFNRTLTCIFWNKITHNTTSLTFHVSEKVKTAKPQEWKFLFALLPLVIIIIFLLAAVYGQYKKVWHIRTTLCNSICKRETCNINANMSSATENSDAHTQIRFQNTIAGTGKMVRINGKMDEVQYRQNSFEFCKRLETGTEVHISAGQWP
ncbi:programmed cell death 1 ligand 1-like isoform X2 [Hyla sarda]|uniref:programmed cell death 1 ligand 1-like isoform X2 n=1 Tax=Hyla sarda TaxID=327740 RepID=UPI0024C41DBB|nr:programmed cell death 1 ligand 1-like isoform X2 [Hyla sarda]